MPDPTDAPNVTSSTPNGSSDPVRKGSPFAKTPIAKTSSGSAGTREADSDTSVSHSPSMVDPHWETTGVLDPEWGVLKASIWASAWVAMFAIACYQLFPGGGVFVTALGCGLAIVGLFSSRPAPASVLLVAHAGLFFACYQRLF